jgi:hypothetical protein
MSKLSIDALAQEIRRVDGNHSLGAGALAEALMPFISAHLAAQAEWPSEEDVRNACAAHDAYGSGVVETPAMRAALQSVRPPAGVVLGSWIQDPDCIPRPIIAACRVAIQREFGISGTDGYYKRILEKVFKSLAPSRHAPTKD